MPVISQTFGLLGQVGVTPRRVQMVVTDTLMAVTTPGYLEYAGVNTNNVMKTDIFDMIYLFNVETGAGTYGEFVPVFASNGIITLIELTSGDITLPVSGADGGTGVSNVGLTITLGGDLETIGAFNSFFTMTGTTNVTFPTSGTLATTDQIPIPVNQTGSTTAAVGHTYVIAGSISSTIALPAIAPFGSIIGIIGYTGGFVITPHAGQNILIMGSNATTSVTSYSVNDNIFLMSVVANTTWVAFSFNSDGFTIV